MPIRLVSPKEWGKTEGEITDMPWLIAEQRFISFFKEHQRGSGLYERVKKKYGCNAANATDWASAVNAVIMITNTISDEATESEVLTAFAL